MPMKLGLHHMYLLLLGIFLQVNVAWSQSENIAGKVLQQTFMISEYGSKLAFLEVLVGQTYSNSSFAMNDTIRHIIYESSDIDTLHTRKWYYFKLEQTNSRDTLLEIAGNTQLIASFPAEYRITGTPSTCHYLEQSSDRFVIRYQWTNPSDTSVAYSETGYCTSFYDIKKGKRSIRIYDTNGHLISLKVMTEGKVKFKSYTEKGDVVDFYVGKPYGANRTKGFESRGGYKIRNRMKNGKWNFSREFI
jgi:hypothetical protein